MADITSSAGVSGRVVEHLVAFARCAREATSDRPPGVEQALVVTGTIDLGGDGDAVARRRYLMAYDIADPKRLRRICTLMEDHGERLQYSVFLDDLAVAELESAVTEVMHVQEDSVVQIDLRSLHAAAPVRALGSPRPLPTTGPGIV